MMLIQPNDDKEMPPLPLQAGSTVLCRAWTRMMMGAPCTLGALTGVGHTPVLGCTVQTPKGGIKVKVSVFAHDVLGGWRAQLLLALHVASCFDRRGEGLIYSFWYCFVS